VQTQDSKLRDKRPVYKHVLCNYAHFGAYETGYRKPTTRQSGGLGPKYDFPPCSPSGLLLVESRVASQTLALALHNLLCV